MGELLFMNPTKPRARKFTVNDPAKVGLGLVIVAAVIWSQFEKRPTRSTQSSPRSRSKTL